MINPGEEFLTVFPFHHVAGLHQITAIRVACHHHCGRAGELVVTVGQCVVTDVLGHLDIDTENVHRR